MIMADKTNTAKSDSGKQHSVCLDNRRRLVITGVTDTDKFNEGSVLLYTCMGEMT